MLHGASPLGRCSPFSLQVVRLSLRARLQRGVRPSITTGLPSLLRLSLFVFFAASSAHALPSRRSGLHEGGGGLLRQQSTAAGEEGLPEPEPLPPAPSEELLTRMHRHNLAFGYGYPFWNNTDLDAEGCQRIVNETAAEGADRDASCIASYSCDFDRLRYPHWLVFTTCTRGRGACEPDGRPGDEFVCSPYNEDILLLRYVNYSRTTARRSSTAAGGGVNASGLDRLFDYEDDKPDEVVESEEKGEWQFWFFEVPSGCRCYQ